MLLRFSSARPGLLLGTRTRLSRYRVLTLGIAVAKVGISGAMGRFDTQNGRRPRKGERLYLCMGLDQPGYKLPLFDDSGQRIHSAIIQSCVDCGWAEPWFANPLAPDWLVCRLTPAGIDAARQAEGVDDHSDPDGLDLRANA